MSAIHTTKESFSERFHFEETDQPLGQGGFAKVYKAQDALRNRAVALKFYTGNTSHKYNLVAEIKKVINLQHPNLIKYYEVYEFKDYPAQVVVMEYAEEGDLHDYIHKKGYKFTKAMLGDILQGLVALEKAAIIHRDIKESNILLTEEAGRLMAKITDFGISKDTNDTAPADSRIGTPLYAAPEIEAPKTFGIDGKVTYNADLWSLGITLFVIFKKEFPFPDVKELMSMAVTKKVQQEIASIPSPFNKVIRACLVKKAQNRVQSAQELLSLLQSGIVIKEVRKSSQVIVKRRKTTKPKEERKRKIKINNIKK